ncbi:MAG TPA: substrate-binding domain-containing protein [Armatimonadaceae bacterium]|nr:substrate-binding domain-containing protein [Armatimonadaceae bacterium]
MADTAADPLYRQIMRRIREELLPDGEAAAPARLPSERTLQARYNVSRPTISKALAALAAEGALVKRERSGVFRADGEPGAVADEAAAGTGNPAVIGYVAPLVAGDLVQRAFRGIDRVASRRGYRVVMGNAGNDWGREREAVHDLIASGARGLIITPYPRLAEQAGEDYLRAERFSVPLVALDTCVPEQPLPQVVFDNVRAGYDAAEWLLGQGHERVALLTFADFVVHGPLRSRLRGYRDALADHGVPEDPGLIFAVDPRLDHASALGEALDAWDALPEPPTAIIAVDDLYAMTLIELLEARGRRVPADVAVFGFDNLHVARRFRPAFPTTDPDFERLGEIGCEMLLDALATGAQRVEQRVLAVPLLTERRLVSPAGTPHPPVRNPARTAPTRPALAGTARGA